MKEEIRGQKFPGRLSYKVFLIGTFCDCHFLPPELPAPPSPLTIWSVLWLFVGVRGDPGARFAAVSADGKRPNQSWTVRRRGAGVWRWEGLNLHLYMNVDGCGGAPIDMLRRWHANHRARGCHLSSGVTGRGGRKKRHTHTHTHTHTLTQGNMYVLLLQITTCTSRHSSENTQYYANRRLCDSGVGHTAPLTADQFTYIPRASLSAACLPLFPNIWLPRCRCASPTLFHCLNSLFICPSLHHTTVLSFPKSDYIFLISQCISHFPTPQSLSQHETGHPVSRICSAVWPLTYRCCLPVTAVSGRAAEADTHTLLVKPNHQPRLIRLDPSLIFEPLNFWMTLKCTEPVKTTTAGATFGQKKNETRQDLDG